VRAAVAIGIDLPLLRVLRGHRGAAIARDAEQVQGVEREVPEEVARGHTQPVEHLGQIGALEQAQLRALHH
jgi:hypothetical protein